MATRRRAAAPPQPPAWTPEPWSDGETSALLDAWGPRNIRAAGGPLRTADWRACAAAVTARRAVDGRAPRTVDQCKNRLDYLKKRLKAERSRLAGTYERVEVAKQKEATRLEERRLEAMRDLEIERMRILVDVAISASAVADTATAASSSW
ncbi:hypothetical protein OsI_11134 [Oryza sativa Indica Group]|uniref:Myb/SANT-like DNA-binding domain-containing protein n=1 Tax=Oryza sativa subsp. indica TaxID=39946 RepID=A2XFJ6_ORYSI|nr:hypothetical protein OsI_11134 [Oryza sativa Indica Group]